MSGRGCSTPERIGYGDTRRRSPLPGLLGSFDQVPELVWKPPEPKYPPEARAEGISGAVVAKVVVRTDGSPEALGVLEWLPYCTVAAIENARSWVWKPALEDGRPVEAPGLVTVAFHIFDNPRR